MRALNKLSPVALATTLVIGSMTAMPLTAQAGVSGTVQAANMYLWRGQNLTPNGAQVSGDLNYSHDAGMYAGVWTSTETGGQETDLYVGFGGGVGGVSYDISYWKYLYPEDCNSATPVSCSLGDTDASEFVVSLGFGPVSVASYIAAESGSDDNNYYTVGVDFAEKFNLTYGFWDLENPGNEYSHVTLMYSFSDELTFGVSVASNDSGYTEEGNAPDATGVTEDPLFYVSYAKSFDLK
ncbi:MAG: TorF family putative porin [Gammaproteobacteria bacterium]|nr:TorF family putative porin [Gammaproteobacteria bacterium]